MEKIKWLLTLLLALMKQGFEGTLMLEFYRPKDADHSVVSKKYRRQVTETVNTE